MTDSEFVRELSKDAKCCYQVIQRDGRISNNIFYVLNGIVYVRDYWSDPTIDSPLLYAEKNKEYFPISHMRRSDYGLPLKVAEKQSIVLTFERTKDIL